MKCQANCENCFGRKAIMFRGFHQEQPPNQNDYVLQEKSPHCVRPPDRWIPTLEFIVSVMQLFPGSVWCYKWHYSPL